MREIEVIEKDIVAPKLTVTNTRISIKFPLLFENREELEYKLLKIAKDIGPIKNTLRGTVKNNILYLKNSTKKEKTTFNIYHLNEL